MKKNLLLIFIAISYLSVKSQLTLTLQPDACLGKDAEISDNNAAINLGATNCIIADRWTCGGTPCHGSSLIQFDLSSIPQGATISSASLSLYANLNAPSGYFGTPTWGTDNACYLKRVTAPWSETSVTWNNQPASTTTNQVLLAQSTSTTQDYLNIDITAFVQYWNQDSTQNYGMLLDVITANYYNSLIFCSSDYPDSTKRPKLIITYTPPLNACLTLHPEGCSGKDAEISDNNAAINLGGTNCIIADRWTCGGNPCHGSSLIQFDLSSIPAGSTINSASLSLYANLNAPSGYFGTPTWGTENACYLKRVTAPWSEASVTWNNQPAATTTGQVLLAQSTSTTQDYPNIDITAFAQYWNQTPAQNYGMLLDVITTNYYNSLVFCSSDYPDSTKRPKLEVCFSIPTSISKISLQMDIKVFPNPATNELNINLGSLRAEQISIYNTDGRHMIEIKQPTNNIDISNLIAGVYIAEIRIRDAFQRVRWVKM